MHNLYYVAGSLYFKNICIWYHLFQQYKYMIQSIDFALPLGFSGIEKFQFYFILNYKKSRMSQYGKTDYWQDRYTRDSEPFDWYQRFSGLKDVITTHIDKSSRLLNVGAGNSRLSQEMYEEGYTNITNIDISNICIKAMKQKYKEKGDNFKYLLMDVKSMDFPQSSFDAVVDKATLDSVLCGQNSTANANKMISEVHRVLSKNGVYLVISYGQPEFRLSYLEKPEYQWSVKVQQVAKPTIASSISIASDQKQTPNVHYIYICRKGDKN